MGQNNSKKYKKNKSFYKNLSPFIIDLCIEVLRVFKKITNYFIIFRSLSLEFGYVPIYLIIIKEDFFVTTIAKGFNSFIDKFIKNLKIKP